MPTFTYKCKNCGHQYDFLMMDKTEAASCPKCQSKNAEKIITGCNVGGGKSSSSYSGSGAGGACACCPHKRQ